MNDAWVPTARGSERERVEASGALPSKELDLVERPPGCRSIAFREWPSAVWLLASEIGRRVVAKGSRSIHNSRRCCSVDDEDDEDEEEVPLALCDGDDSDDERAA